MATATLPATAVAAEQSVDDLASTTANPQQQSARAWSSAAAQPNVGWRSAELQALLAKQNSKGAIGIVAAAQSTKGQWAGAAGDRVLGKDKAQPGDKVRVGSITKPLVSTVLLQLVEQHRVGLNTRVDDVLPGVLGKRGKQITLEQLLSHRSGMPDYIVPIASKAKTVKEFASKKFTDKQLVAAALKQKWLSKPGTATSYSNTNYIVAGMMAEKLTSRSMKSLIEHRVFARAGMHDSHYAKGARFPDPHLTEYANEGTGRQSFEQNASVFGAAGAVISTPEDLDRFWRSLFTGKLLKQSTVNNMVTPRGKLENVVDYGLGIISTKIKCGTKSETVHGHNGTTLGTFSASFGTRDGRAQASASLTGRLFTEDALKKQVMPEPVTFAALQYACSD